MLVLVSYDVSTADAAGKKRLRNVAKTCEDYGIRVQNSVFECNVDESQFLQFKSKLLKWCDMETDSLRFYRLGNNYKCRIEHFGAKPAIDVEEPLIM